MTTQIKRFQGLLLAVVLGTGTLAVWMLMLMLIYGATVVSWQLDGVRPEQLLIFRDGTPIIKSYDDSGYAEHRTLDGKEVKLRPSAHGTLLPARATDNSQYARTSWKSRLQTSYHLVGAPTIWYLVKDGQIKQRAYFECYNKTTKLKIGCVGRNGLRKDSVPQSEQFRLISDQILYPRNYANLGGYYKVLDMQSPLYLLTVDGLVAISLNEGKVKVIRRDANVVSAGMAQNDNREVLVLRTPDKLIVSDLNGRELVTYTLPADLRDVGWKWYGLSYGNVALLVRDLPGRHDLFWIDESGKILRHEHVVLPGNDSQTRKWFLRNLTTVGICSPSLMMLAMAWNPWDYPDRPRGSMEYTAAMYQAFLDIRYGLLVVIAMSTVLAYVCYRHQCNYGLPWTGVWTGFVLLFGLPAYFGYLAHRAWPARLACPHCGRRVPRDRLACFACGREFPPPARKGIEVFA